MGGLGLLNHFQTLSSRVFTALFMELVCRLLHHHVKNVSISGDIGVVNFFGDLPDELLLGTFTANAVLPLVDLVGQLALQIDHLVVLKEDMPIA